MTTEQEKALRDLERQARQVLELFPWPDDSSVDEDGTPRAPTAGMRTTQQVAAERNLRRIRAALRNLLEVIDS